jgi:hypothetical protein
VTQARNNAPQTAAFARRVVCRALTVIGGVAAGTALAWWLSSTAASAETNSPAADDVAGVVQQVAAPAAEPVRQTLDTVVRQLQDPPAPPKDALSHLGQKVKDAADHFRGKAELPKLPSCSTCLHNDRHMYPVSGFDRSDLPGTPALAPVATTPAPGVVVDALVPNTAKDRALADGMSRRGSPAPATPVLPELPNWPVPLPFTPGGVPTTGNHGPAGNAADSHLFAVLPWQERLDADSLVAGGIAAATDAATFGRPGAQPGVAPD